MITDLLICVKPNYQIGKLLFILYNVLKYIRLDMVGLGSALMMMWASGLET